MSLHLGSDFSISLRNIVCIMRLDPDRTLVKSTQRQNSMEKIRKIGSPPYHSAILGIKGTLYLTPFTVRTLVGRIRKNSTHVQLVEREHGKRT